MNLQSEEVLSAVVERLMKAMRSVRPGNVRQFFALVNQHMRWELNDLARRLDAQQAMLVPLPDSFAADLADGPPSDGSQPGGTGPGGEATRRVLAAIDGLPEEEREVLNLVQVQGLTHAEAAAVIGVSSKTIQRRLNRSLLLLTDQLGDLVSPSQAAGDGSEASPADA
jgi:RNA polymerase sigma-70 factor (ECF subfamily)